MAKSHHQTHGDFNPEKQKEILDDVTKSLRDLQQELIKKSVQCQELQVDLATQFNPRTMKKALGVKSECQKCSDYLLSLKKDRPSNTA